MNILFFLIYLLRLVIVCLTPYSRRHNQHHRRTELYFYQKDNSVKSNEIQIPGSLDYKKSIRVKTHILYNNNFTRILFFIKHIRLLADNASVHPALEYTVVISKPIRKCNKQTLDSVRKKVVSFAYNPSGPASDTLEKQTASYSGPKSNVAVGISKSATMWSTHYIFFKFRLVTRKTDTLRLYATAATN